MGLQGWRKTYSGLKHIFFGKMIQFFGFYKVSGKKFN